MLVQLNIKESLNINPPKSKRHLDTQMSACVLNQHHTLSYINRIRYISMATSDTPLDDQKNKIKSV